MNVPDHIVTAIHDTTLDEDPMHHIEIYDFLPDDTYWRLVENLPPDSWYKTLSPDSKKGAGTRALMGINDSPAWCHGSAQGAWHGVVDALSGDFVRMALIYKFHVALSQRFGMDLGQLMTLDTTPLVRLSRDTEGFYLAPHCDKPSKVITLQLYLPPDGTQHGLGTSLYGPGGKQEVKRMPFIPNFAYAFPMTKIGKPSWHGVERIGKINYPRDSLVFGLHIHD